MKKRRCNHKMMTKEANILKFMRESRKLSMRKAGALLGVSDSTISHIENGRADLRPEITLRLLKMYDYTFEQFISMGNGEMELPHSLRRECLEIIKRLDEEKLKTVKVILHSF